MQGRVVLITGGTGALGSAVAQSTLEAGATTVVTYRDARDIDALKGRVPAAARDRLHGAQADVTDGVSVGRLVTEVTARSADSPGATSSRPTSAAGTGC
jgi:NAD(P)-dependent dehydrogenase (short-subunit alcohol dehydrogenase family)